MNYLLLENKLISLIAPNLITYKVFESLPDKTGLGFVESITMSAPHSINFVPSSSSEPLVSEVVKASMSEAKSIEVTPPKKIRVDLHESKPKASNPLKGKTRDKPA